MRISELWRYPVKSMRGEQCESLELNPRGVVGDRLFAIRDAAGKFGSGKNTRRFRKIDGLFSFAAAFDGDTPMLTFPDGDIRAGDDPDIDEALTTALGQPVTLAREGDISHFDAGPVHLLSTGSIAWLKDRLPGIPIDARRFRPNIVIATEGKTRAEQAWLGKTIAVSGATLRVHAETERCGMVTFAQDTLPGAPEILRTIAQENDLQFGVYADVVSPGTARVEDRVELGSDWGSYSRIL